MNATIRFVGNYTNVAVCLVQAQHLSHLFSQQCIYLIHNSLLSLCLCVMEFCALGVEHTVLEHRKTHNK